MTGNFSCYRERAGAEFGQAKQAAKPEAIKAHRDLANAYLARIGEPAKKQASV